MILTHCTSLGQEDEVLLTSSKHVDRHAIDTSGLPALVRQDAEGWEPACDVACNQIDVARLDMTETPHTGAAAGSSRARLDPFAICGRHQTRARDYGWGSGAGLEVEGDERGRADAGRYDEHGRAETVNSRGLERL